MASWDPTMQDAKDTASSTTTIRLFPSSGRSTPDVDNVIVYADESGSSAPDGSREKRFAVGLEFGLSPIPLDFAAALQGQRTCGPDPITGRARCFKREKRRAFFHATEDCLDCRALLQKAIKDTLPDRFFVSMRWNHVTAGKDAFTGSELHQDLYSELLKAVHRLVRPKRITFRFEQIQGLSEGILKTWLRNDVDYRVQVMVDTGVVLPLLPTGVEMVTKSDPGVQVCDHLLWLENRRWSGEAERIADAGFDRQHIHMPFGAWEISIYQHGDLDKPLMRQPEGSFDDVPRERWALMLWEIEQSVRGWVSDVDMEHLRPIFEAACERARAGGRDAAFDMCRAFLAGAGAVLQQAGLSEAQFQGGTELTWLAVWMCRQQQNGNDGALPSLLSYLQERRKAAHNG